MIYPIGRYLMPPLYKLWLGKVEGMENIPKKGPFIIALNHTSYYETIIMYALLIPKLDVPIHALVNSRYWKNQIFKIIIEWGKAIPVYLGKDHDPRKNERALQKAETFLNQGHIIQIFPEGTRSADGVLKEGKTGVARLALKTGVPVIPIGVMNANKILPKGAIILRPVRATVRIGKPLFFKKQRHPSKKSLTSTTRKVMQEIAVLVGQRYPY